MFWIFALSWFNDEDHVSWQSWAIILITTLISVFVWVMRTNGADKIITIPVRFIWLTFIIWGLWSAWRGRDNDLIEARRNLRFLFIAMVGGTIAIITIIYLIYNIFLDDLTLYIFTITINIIITCITYFLILSIIRAHPKDLFASVERSNLKNLAMDSKQEELKERLERYMVHERPYRNESLTITIVANALGQQEYRLRRLINGKLGYRNFSTFLNHYRLLEVKEALVDPNQIDVSILTIALDSGFGSLAPFNRAFRQTEGITHTIS